MSRLNGLVRTFQSTVTGMKAFLHRQRWKEALIFFCFVLLSFGFWLLQSLQQEYETELSIPLRYENVPANIALAPSVAKQVRIHVKDKGSALLNYTLGQKFRSITLDVQKLRKDEMRYIVSRSMLQDEISKQLLASTTLTLFEPQALSLPFDEQKSKEVPVVFNGSIETEGGFLVSGDILISPSMVTIYGSASLLDSIQEVRTEFLKIEKGKKTLVKNASLEAIEGVAFHTEGVSVTIPIEEYTEKTLTIPVRFVQVPPQYTIRSFPQEVEVSCNIPVSKFKMLTEELLVIEIPFRQLEENVSGSLAIDLSSRPEWLKTYRIDPNKIEFLLEQNARIP
ncbi:YbbR-like domain-containing protein [Parabacteroides sp. An277]|uniref:CdaR family protein n=1 Tax=Parabacteroides sp. An277 TaxID=1965619 RepID=UPI0013A62352|nr:YbbR-like domain-containing protein [Parabacteroides sp. An277]